MRATENSLGVKGHRSVIDTSNWFCALDCNLPRGQMVIRRSCILPVVARAAHHQLSQ